MWSLYHPDTWGGDPIVCKVQVPAWNEWREWREWLAIYAEAAGFKKATAICQFIRWRAKGSPIDELPPGVPKPKLAKPACQQPPEQGPGTELHKLIAQLGITPDASCGCEAMRLKMNAWGAEGCRANRAEIMAHLQKAYASTDWPTKLKAGAVAISQGLPLTIDGLLDLAIDRASPPAPPAA